jgi:AbrB family looped-hinge helix DNA binding protein
MSATIDSAGRVVIPKALRDRAGLAPGTRVDFTFHDGSIQVSPVAPDVQWEQVGRVRYPVIASPGLSTDEIEAVIVDGRDDQLERLGRAGR